jgi:hypothetical protein
MNAKEAEIHICINCHMDEYGIPLTEWRMATESFWLCPKCLPHFIHRFDEVMSKWRLNASQPFTGNNRGGSHAQG